MLLGDDLPDERQQVAGNALTVVSDSIYAIGTKYLFSSSPPFYIRYIFSFVFQ